MSKTLGLGSKPRNKWPQVLVGLIVGNAPTKGLVDFSQAKTLRSLRDEVEKRFELHAVHFEGH